MEKNNGVQKRDSFSSKFGIIAAAAGSAIGLGNIWKFPYIVGQNGGSAFILIYLVCILLVGIPIMLAEFVVGRRGAKNASASFSEVAPGTKWHISGFIGIISAFLILSFYGVVAGWTLHYMFISLGGNLSGMATDAITNLFVDFISDDFVPVVWQIIFMMITAAIVIGGVKDGIEKVAKFLMPLLFVIIIVLDVRALTLPGSSAGLEFLFKPDWSKVGPDVILAALGQAFFTLSLGMGIMLTYGSYIKKEENLRKTAIQVTIFDTLIALLAALAIFPAAFAFGIEAKAGPSLVFITLPNVFDQMFGGAIFTFLFFALLFVAALTSSISILEVSVAYISEQKNMPRLRATLLITSIITMVGVFASLSMGKLANVTFPFFEGGEWIRVGFFDLLDKFTANFLLLIAGFLVSIFVGWKMNLDDVKDELTSGGKYKISGFVFNVLIWSLRIIAPAAIIFILLSNLGLVKF